MPAKPRRGTEGLISYSARGGLGGPAEGVHGPGLARPATRGLRNTLPGAHAEPSVSSPCKMPLGTARGANLARRTRTAGPCGERQGLSPRLDPDGQQPPPVSQASGEAPRTASRHGAVPKRSSHDVKAIARQVPARVEISKSSQVVAVQHFTGITTDCGACAEQRSRLGPSDLGRRWRCWFTWEATGNTSTIRHRGTESCGKATMGSRR